VRVVGLDLGGANLKAADVDGRAVTIPFPVWRHPEGLSGAIGRLLAEFGGIELLAVTMTAELADCFRTKSEGVDRVLHAVERAAEGTPVAVWQTGAEFMTPEVARQFPELVAAANWHALATFVGRLVPEGEALLLDLGSTTTDIIPLSQGFPVPVGLTDRDRLISGELVYSGVRRTPLCALVSAIPWRGTDCPVAAELFATTLDVYLTLGGIAENPLDTDTANGRPATRRDALDRLARSVCCDATEFTPEDAEQAARHVARVQEAQIAAAANRVLDRFAGPCGRVLLSGSGVFLAERVARNLPRLKQVAHVRLNEMFDPAVSEAACAFAVARLAAERHAAG